jgi:hypothetical protein
MSALSNPAARQLWVRIVRISIALAIMRVGGALYALADRLLPEDFRLGRADRDRGDEK